MHASAQINAYPLDLEPSLQDELIQFISYAKNHVTQHPSKPNTFEHKLLHLVAKSDVRELFSNVDVNVAHLSDFHGHKLLLQ